jgi:DNA mismatch repair protein MutS
MKDKETPLMRQYKEMKAKNPDAVMLFRMGDFFETFENDAVIASTVCGITLTKRNNGDAGEVPLAGFPYHQLDVYLPKLVRAGYRVAVCEQVEDPKQAKGIVKRDIVEVVTPGIGLYDKLLDAKRNTYVAAISVQFHKSGFMVYGVSFADISTGEFSTCEIAKKDIFHILELCLPAEIIISKSLYRELQDDISDLPFNPSITKLEDWIFEYQFAYDVLVKHFNTKNVKGFGIHEMHAGIIAAGAVLQYIQDTQKSVALQISRISVFNPSEFMTLDYATRRNLEILSSMNDQAKEGSLLAILDHTKTPMGSRLFKMWVGRPLRSLHSIQERLSAVKSFVNSGNILQECEYIMKQIGDLERLIAKVCAGRCNPRDLYALKKSLDIIPLLKELLGKTQLSPYLISLVDQLVPLDQLTKLIEQALQEEAPVVIGNGNVFNRGYSSILDEYVEAMYSGKNWIQEYMQRERDLTGISSLKISSNGVFGYYIEISNTHKSKVPEQRYERRQTLANAERYITEELKNIEEKIVNASDKISELEQNLFLELRLQVIEYTEQIQALASVISKIDCLHSFASVSKQFKYSEPIINENNDLHIIGGRHPVVERMLNPGNSFVSNSTVFDAKERIHIITGPNMAGKSCYLRQVGLIVLMAQIGCYVPAESAIIGIVDRIFTRVGAQDNISAGESTFLVEMQEAANILNNATEKSLLLLDEVGRGTATFDGISIAWAIAEYVHDILNSRVLFATHYHELTSLTEHLSRAVNYKVEVKEVLQSLLFTHKVIPGTSDHSFGIHVAHMAGLPPSVISRANKILSTLETSSPVYINSNAIEYDKKNQDIHLREPESQFSMFEIRDDAIRRALQDIDINALSPLQAFEALIQLIKKL